jgi:RluA family pseudouridine synthase
MTSMLLTNEGTQVPAEEVRRLGPELQKKDQGASLIDFLGKAFPFFTVSEWYKAIELGKVTINGFVTTNPKMVLRAGDRLGRIHPIEEEPNVDTNIELLWQEDDVAVISKPGGLPIHEAGLFRRKTVCSLLKNLLGLDWLPVHRLDNGTSGVLLCAKGSKLRSALARDLESHRIQKTYLALVSGCPSTTIWTDTRAIVPSTRDRHHAICADGDRAQTAETRFKVLKSDSIRTLVEATPVTGRTHQIRVHLASGGLPIVGDQLYSEVYSPSGFQYGQLSPTPKRMYLHAHEISFAHPVSKKWVSVKSKPEVGFSLEN